MLTISQIKDLYKKHDVSASKNFGQNFLIDKNVLEKIISFAKENSEGEEVIEVGPGLGSLTYYLLDNYNKVTSYEIDNNMIRVLQQEIKSEKFNLIQEDFLKADFNWDNKKVLVANIPYYITSDILFKIFRNHSKFSRCVLMVQEEVADRMTAKISTSNYGKLTITTELITKNLKKEMVIKPSSFFPSPKVNSAIISFDLMDQNIDWELIEFIKKIFSHRRKTLVNNLRSLNFSVDEIKHIFEDTNQELNNRGLIILLHPNIRSQELSLDHISILFMKQKIVKLHYGN